MSAAERILRKVQGFDDDTPRESEGPTPTSKVPPTDRNV